MIDSNETLAYENGRDAGYSEGYQDAINHVAKIISDACGSGACPFKEGCDVHSNKACIERIVGLFSE